MISRPSGRRDLLIYDQRDPDAVMAQAELSAEESVTLAEALGGPLISEPLDALPSTIAGLVVDWVPLPADARAATIGQLELRRKTGASVVAIIRDEQPIPAPGPDDELRPGDTVVLVGTPQGVQAAVQRMGA